MIRIKAGDRVRFPGNCGTIEGVVLGPWNGHPTLLSVESRVGSLTLWIADPNHCELLPSPADTLTTGTLTTCPDCNGTRVYADGFHAPEPCRLCSGRGTV